MEDAGRRTSLDSSVLVLNRFYLAVHVINVRRALVLLYRSLAEVVDVHEGQYWNYDFDAWREISEFHAADEPRGLNERDWIRCVNFQLQVPRVVRLYRYDRVPQRKLRFNRRTVFARDDHSCQYCGKCYSSQNLSFDHVVPRSRGGSTCWENVVCCCLKCNTRKGNRTPGEAGMKLIKRPRKPHHNPMLSAKLANPKYDCWRSFLVGAGQSVEVA